MLVVVWRKDWLNEYCTSRSKESALIWTQNTALKAVLYSGVYNKKRTHWRRDVDER